MAVARVLGGLSAMCLSVEVWNLSIRPDVGYNLRGSSLGVGKFSSTPVLWARLVQGISQATVPLARVRGSDATLEWGLGWVAGLSWRKSSGWLARDDEAASICVPLSFCLFDLDFYHQGTSVLSLSPCNRFNTSCT